MDELNFSDTKAKVLIEGQEFTLNIETTSFAKARDKLIKYAESGVASGSIDYDEFIKLYQDVFHAAFGGEGWRNILSETEGGADLIKYEQLFVFLVKLNVEITMKRRMDALKGFTVERAKRLS